MPAIRGVTVAVGPWYAATLEICLVRNMRHFTECVVVTTPGDEEVRAVVEKVPGAILSTTDAFTRHGARFNKGLALEEAGFDAMGRRGYILVHDSDILLPDAIDFGRMPPRPGCLHGARRRVLEDASSWRPGRSWADCRTWPDGSPIGFFQLFHAEDPHLAGKRPWYDVSFGHAGGSDAAFMAHWPKDRWSMLPTEVLHLGPVDTHWFGTDQTSKDMMARFVTENRWPRAMARHSPEAAARAAEPVHRVEVPGFEKSTFELLFVRRAQQHQQQQGR